MGLFSRTPAPSQPPRPASRTIPTLEPDFFERIHRRLIDNRGSLSSTTIAAGVGNAIYNTATGWLATARMSSELRDFEALYGDRSQSDRTAADRMIDYMVRLDPRIQQPDGFLGRLLPRLEDVLSRPE